MATVTIRFSPAVFGYAAAVLASLAYLSRGIARVYRLARDVTWNVRRLRLDVAHLKQAQGVPLSRAERELLDDEGEL